MKELQYFLFFVSLLLLLASCQAPSSEPVKKSGKNRPPNILWITNEDMSPRLGCYGDTVARTPNIDRLAAEGLLFRQAFSISGVCSPSRSALITGCYPTSISTLHHRTTTADNPYCAPYLGVPPPDVKAFPEYLRRAGYYCTNNSKTDYQFGVPVTIWDENGPAAHWRKRPDPEQPFFAVFNTALTHESRLFRRERVQEMVDEAAAKGQNTSYLHSVLAHDRTRLTNRATVPLPPYFPDHPEVREDVARQYDNIRLMDAWVGDLLRQLEEDGLADNTIVFYFSDHGTCLPRGKRWLYDSGIRVPLIIRFPDGRNAGAATDRLVSFVDFAPTVLSLAGIEPPAAMQGRAFLGPYETAPRDYIFAARDRTDALLDQCRAVRDRRYKYIQNWNPEISYGYPLEYAENITMNKIWRELSQNGVLSGPAARWHAPKPAEELYDLQADPHEIDNLAGDPAQAATLQRLRRELETWQVRTHDQGGMPEQALRDSLWPGGKQPVTASPQFKIDGAGRLTLSCPTPGASIAYRRPGIDSIFQLYLGPTPVPPGTEIIARTIRYGFRENEASWAAE